MWMGTSCPLRVDENVCVCCPVDVGSAWLRETVPKAVVIDGDGGDAGGDLGAQPVVVRMLRVWLPADGGAVYPTAHTVPPDRAQAPHSSAGSAMFGLGFFVTVLPTKGGPRG